MDNIYSSKGTMQFTRQASLSDAIGLGQRPEIVQLSNPVAHTPQALCAWNHRHRAQGVPLHKRTWAGHHAPARAIPLLRQSIGQVLAVFERSHRPHVSRREGSHARKHRTSSEGWTYDRTPFL